MGRMIAHAHMYDRNHVAIVIGGIVASHAGGVSSDAASCIHTGGRVP